MSTVKMRELGMSDFEEAADYSFHISNGALLMDWGHYCRAFNLPWTWIQRVMAWNPCNHIGNLYGYD